MAYKGLIPGRFPTAELKRSRVLEVSPHITMIEGYISDSFFFKPPSCNCFVLRDLATFLFTDIEGSSKLWEHEPEKMKVALQRHP